MNLDQLAQLAARATPGRWAADGSEIYAGEGSARMWVGETLDLHHRARTEANAAYIAACSPDRVKVLIAVARCADILISSMVDPIDGISLPPSLASYEDLCVALAVLEETP